MKHNIGQIMKERKIKAMGKVKDYFHQRPFSSQQECAEALGMSKESVSRHVRALRKEAAERK